MYANSICHLQKQKALQPKRCRSSKTTSYRARWPWNRVMASLLVWISDLIDVWQAGDFPIFREKLRAQGLLQCALLVGWRRQKDRLTIYQQKTRLPMEAWFFVSIWARLEHLYASVHRACYSHSCIPSKNILPLFVIFFKFTAVITVIYMSAKGSAKFIQEAALMSMLIFTEDRCVMCGVLIPEGRMICPNCEQEVLGHSPLKQETKATIPFWRRFFRYRWKMVRL